MNRELAAKHLFVPNVIWGAFLAAPLLYVYVAYNVSPTEGDRELDDLLFLVLTAFSSVSAAAAIALPRAALTDKKLRGHARSLEFESRQDDASSAEERRVSALAQIWFTPWLIAVALAEAVVIYGLVLAFMADRPVLILPYAATTILVLVFKKPRLEPLLRRAEALAR